VRLGEDQIAFPVRNMPVSPSLEQWTLTASGRSCNCRPLRAISAQGAAHRVDVGYKFAWLSSAGFGVRTGIGERLTATALLAKPLTYDSRLAALGISQGTRFRFTLGVQY
jgi:hypothetical protein